MIPLLWDPYDRRGRIEQAADVVDLGVVVSELSDWTDEVVFEETNDRRVFHLDVRDGSLPSERSNRKEWHPRAVGHPQTLVVDVDRLWRRHMIKEATAFIPRDQNERTLREGRFLNHVDGAANKGDPVCDRRNIRMLVVPLLRFHIGEVG